jgi:hypothetical protein
VAGEGDGTRVALGFVKLCFIVIPVQIGGEKLVSIADVDSKARPRLDAVDEELIRDQ